MSQEIIAKIAGKELTQADYNEFLKKLPPEQRAYAEHPQAKEMYMEQFYAMHLFAAEGKELKLDETEEYKAILETMKQELVGQLAMSKTVEGIEVTDEEVKAFYDANPQMFVQGETVQAKHILVDEEAKAEELKLAIEAGAVTFEEAARDNSNCPSKEAGGDLGTFGRGQMVPEFDQAAFEAEVDKVVGPVKTDFGYHLIKVISHTEATTQEFEVVKAQLKDQLWQQKSNEAFGAKLAELKEKFMDK